MLVNLNNKKLFADRVEEILTDSQNSEDFVFTSETKHSKPLIREAFTKIINYELKRFGEKRDLQLKSYSFKTSLLALSLWDWETKIFKPPTESSKVLDS